MQGKGNGKIAASRYLRGWIAAGVLLLLAGGAAAQQDLPANGVLLVARPELRDPNFSRTVVLVTQTEDGGTVGVVLNRPTPLKLSQFLGAELPTGNYREPIFAGGPVMRRVLVMLFRTESVPAHAAFHVLKNVYLTMHPDNVAQMLADPAAVYRIYAGFSGWAPRQLESEMMRESWYFLPADEETVFAARDEDAWDRLVDRAKRLGPRI